MLAFRDNIFANPEGLIAYIAKHPEGARVRPDMKVVFFDEWDTPEERLKGATGILRDAGRDCGEGEEGGVIPYRRSDCWFGIYFRRNSRVVRFSRCLPFLRQVSLDRLEFTRQLGYLRFRWDSMAVHIASAS